MTKKFESKVLYRSSVDTRKYRYVAKKFADHLEIRRIELSKLDTTAALTDWETVKIYK